ASPVHCRALHHRFLSPSARVETRDRARSPVIRQGPLHRAPFLPGQFGSVDIKFSTRTTDPSPACARRESFPGRDHQSLWQVRAGRACKSYIPHSKSLSYSGRQLATPSDASSGFPTEVSLLFANRRMLRKNFRVQASAIPRSAGSTVVRNFSPPCHLVE